MGKREREGGRGREKWREGDRCTEEGREGGERQSVFVCACVCERENLCDTEKDIFDGCGMCVC